MIEGKDKFLISAPLILFGLGIVVFISSLSVGRLRIIACDVGQGDGFLIVTPKGKQIVIDGGEGNRMSGCLGSKMPFWDRKIEMMFGTHAQKDHIEAQVDVMERYRVERIFGPVLPSEAAFYKAWVNASKKEEAALFEAARGNKIYVDGVLLEILWPSAEKLALWKLAAPSDLNESSQVMRLSYGNFCAYFTGDITKEILESLASQGEALRGCQVLKVAHHGSRTGTSKLIVEKLDPKVAIIQSGKNNRYGHPHKEVVDIFVSKGVKTVRNDTNGVIELVTDGNKYRFKNEK